MNEQANVESVKRLFAAFLRSDIPAFLDGMSDDIEWRELGPLNLLPWAGTRRGREQVAQLFTLIGELAEFAQLEPQEFIAQGDKVVVLGYERGRVKSTGCIWETNFVDVLTLREGKVSAFHYYGDTAAIVTAFRPA